MRRSRSPLLAVAMSLSALGAAKVAEPDTGRLADLAERGKFVEVKRLLDADADPSIAQADGMTALHWAAHHDAADLVKLLLKSGADAGAKNRYGVSPLSIACQNGNAETVEVLLAAGVDPNTTLPGGETALMTAARTGRVRPVELLLNAGAEVDAKERNKQTALMWAAAEGHAEVVSVLLAAGADADARLRSGFTPLMFAIREGQSGVVDLLLAAGCDVNAVMKTGEGSRFSRERLRLTPLLMAIENGHFELARRLIEAGADVNAEPSGTTALQALTWVRKPIRGDGNPSPIGSGKISSLEMARFLVEAGADINARLRNGKSGLGRFNYTGATPFLLAAQASDVPLMRLLIELGADPAIPNADGSSALLAACGVGALGDGDESAGTELEAIAAVDYLLGLGLDINAVDSHGETVMHGAAYQSLPNLIRLLSQRGADCRVWNHENRSGWTPRSIALGYRPGNFRPAPETLAAIDQALAAAGVEAPVDADPKEHTRTWTGEGGKQPWVLKDLEYARAGDHQLLLDLYLPWNVADADLVVWVHGGAWRSGSKEKMPLGNLVDAGFAVASVDYRLSPVARFPAQVHDIKAAVRYLRAISSRYKFRAKRVAIVGASAGGHLAALVGVTNGHRELEGELGEHLDQSSEVHAIVDYYGPSNLLTILPQSTPHGLGVRIPALQLLLGDQPEDVPELAGMASPVDHVDPSDPPLLLIHGDQDPQVPINQSHEMVGAYKRQGLHVRLDVLHGGAHGGEAYFEPAVMEKVEAFLRRRLQEGR